MQKEIALMVQTILWSRHLLNDNRHHVRSNLRQRTSLERVFLGSLIDPVSMLCWILVSNERFHFCTLVANRVVALNTFFLVAQAGRSQFINQSTGNRGCVSRTGLRGQGGCKFFVCLGVLQQREITRWRGSTARKFGHQVKLRMAGPASVVNWKLQSPTHRRNPASGLGPDGEDRKVECALAGSFRYNSQGHRRELLSPTIHGRTGNKWRTLYLCTQMDAYQEAAFHQR